MKPHHHSCIFGALFLLSCIYTLSYGAPSDSLHENLHLQVLPDGKVLSQFSFVIHWELDTRDNHSYQHTNLFPKALSTIIHDTKVDELHLSFTQGRWRYQAWGLPASAAPTGVALRAWFRENDPSRVDHLWKQLVYSLGGVFCGSLQYLDNRTTTHPIYSFSPEEHNPSYLSSPFGAVSHSFHRMRYGALPREAVCTENHTPWLKLLPCRDQAGLSYLMNPLRVYDVHYHSMQTHAQRVSNSITLNLTLTTVMDTNVENWQLSSLFGRPKSSITSCPLAKETRISFSGIDSPVFELSPNNYESTESGKTAVYDLKKEPFQNGFDFDFKRIGKQATNLSPIPSTLLATRVLTGYGGERGGFKVHITNPLAQELNVTYFESVPWFVRIYFHTLQITINGERRDVTELPCARILPAELRGTPSMLELCLIIPPEGKVILSMEFEKEFLHYSEFPPDAHRGFDLPAAIVTTKLQNNTFARIYTENLLLSLPTPDFSMLYNVITLTSTVIALFFGSIFNMSIRRLKDTFTGQEFVSDRPLARLYRLLSSKFKRFRKNETKETNENKESSSSSSEIVNSPK